MGKSNKNRKLRCSCGRLRRNKSSDLCMKCYKEKLQHQKRRKTLDSPQTSSKLNTKRKKKANLGGKMDSKHFSSRSTTDNLPSSLSTPGERAGLTATSPSSSVDTSVATSSTNTNTMSPHLPSTCGTSGPADITPHSTTANPITSDAEAEASRPPPPPPPDANDSQTSLLSDTSDKPYDPKNEPSICSSTSSINSHTSFSELSAAISSSTKAHKDELKGNGQCGNDDDSATNPSPSAKNPTSSSVSSPNNGQSNITTDNKPSTACNGKTIKVAFSSNKDTVSLATDKSCEPKDSAMSAKFSLPGVGNLLPPVSSSILKDVIKPSTDDQSPQSPSPRGTKRSHAEIENTSESSNSPKPSPQKNKKRCFVCSCKLELAQRTIGKCRCDHVFCPTHRLPELHDCDFNHKEDGRREAREKMVKPTRHMGTSFRRDDQT